MRILNQVTETLTVRDLAHLVSRLTGTRIEYFPTPRVEAEENSLLADNRCFLEMGLKPTTLAEGLLEEVISISRRFGDRCDTSRIPCLSYWNEERRKAAREKRG